MTDEVLPVLALRSGVLVPYAMLPIAIGRASTEAAVDAALASEEKRIFVVGMQDSDVEVAGPDSVYRTGTIAVITQMQRLPVPAMQLLVTGQERAVVKAFVSTEPHLTARVEPWPLTSEPSTELEGLKRAVVGLAEKAAALSESGEVVSLESVLGVSAPVDKVVYFIASLFAFREDKILAVLSASNANEALQILKAMLDEEIAILEIKHRIASRTVSELTEQQRRHILEQQLASIRAELGEKSPEEAEIEMLESRASEVQLPENVEAEVRRELTRLRRLPAASQEHHVIRDRIDLILDLPWADERSVPVDLTMARRILNEDHHDLDDVKDRILEHLAVRKLNPAAKSPILCFVGPPGVGKTSLGHSIARAIGCKFERLSLGGLHDEAELRGHRRTYVGAIPGRLIRAIRMAKARDPVIMLDEVDKLGRDFRGDPAAALLEVLDPEQQDTFHDNYLDLPFDLSRVFFITTANTLDSIPKPLLDRMEILRLPGYTDLDKLAIAQRFIIPRQIERAGLQPDTLSIDAKAILRLVGEYTWEAGVRQLEQRIGSLSRKVALSFAEGADAKVVVEAADLEHFLGPAPRVSSRRRTSLQPGVAAGLAWTEAGGDVLYVEAIALPDGDGLVLTGHLGDVMKESARAARSYLLANASDIGLDETKLATMGIHIHVPSGATPKDGPSAGVTMATAIASLILGVPARADTAMTGEVTLTGLVLPVGGIREKVLAADRLGLLRVVLPRDNEGDLDKLPDEVRRRLTFIFARDLADVLQAALVTPRRAAA